VALSVCAVAVIIGATAVATYLAASGGHPNVQVPPGRLSNSYVVIDSGGTNSTFVDFATGTSHTVTLAGKGGGDDPYRLFVTDNSFVYPGGGGAFAVPTALDRPPRFLGTGTYDIPSSTPGRVWLITTNLNGAPSSATAQEVSVDGSYQTPLYPLPSPGAIAAVNGGLVVAGGNQSFVWYPATNTTGPRLSSSGSEFVDSNGSLLAWGRDCSPSSVCKSVEVLDLARGNSRTYPAPMGTAGWVSTAGQGSHNAFDPNVRRLALRAALTPGQPNAPPPSRAYVLDRASGKTTLVPHSNAPAYSRLAWTPDGQWVLADKQDRSIGAYRPSNAAYRTLPVQNDAIALLSIPK
jgi:hypothetical protein